MGFNVLGFTNPTSCNVATLPVVTEGSSRPFPVLALRISNAMQVQHSLQHVNQRLNFTYSRSHAFRYGSQNKNSGCFSKIELAILAVVGMQG